MLIAWRELVRGSGQAENGFWQQGYGPRVIGKAIRVPATFEQLLVEADRDLGCGDEVAASNSALT